MPASAIKALALATALLPVAAGAAEREPPVAPPSGAETVDTARTDDATYPLITDAVRRPGGTQANLEATRTLDGALARYTYRLPGAEPRRAFAHYLNALESQGFEVLFECDGASCGEAFAAASPGQRLRPALFGGGDQRYLAARLDRDLRDRYVAVQVTAGGEDAAVRVQVDVLQVQPREVAAITVDADAMARELRDAGHVALYGIYFDTDSARLKPSSDPTLREIARLLDQEPALRLLVVGHTDTRGDFDYNIDLSRRRARSVVAALVEEHGVDPARLKPWGVGFTAPDDTNRTRSGRATNRRVELVTW